MTGYRARRGRMLTNGPHSVEVFPATVKEGRTGRIYEHHDGIVIDKVLIQPSAGNALKAAEIREADGDLTDETTFRVYGTGRVWPGGAHSLVKVLVGPVGYEGKTYQQSGEPVTYDASPMTRHFAVRCDTLGAVAK